MNKERMETLRDVMVGVAKRGAALDLSEWARLVLNEDGAACGTTACAIGWAALDPRLQGQGLHLETTVSQVWIRDAAHLDEMIRDGRTFVLPVYLEVGGFHAAMEFFGTTMHETLHLFHPSSYDWEDRPGPRAVIERIDALLAAETGRQHRGNANGKALAWT